MKKCPFCAEEIQDEAIKCKHCGEFLTVAPARPPAGRWYHRNTSFVVAFLLVGPFALPLLWTNPRHSKTTKIVVTLLVLAVTWFLFAASWRALNVIMSYYRTML